MKTKSINKTKLAYIALGAMYWVVSGFSGITLVAHTLPKMSVGNTLVVAFVGFPAAVAASGAAVWLMGLFARWFWGWIHED